MARPIPLAPPVSRTRRPESPLIDDAPRTTASVRRTGFAVGWAWHVSPMTAGSIGLTLTGSTAGRVRDSDPGRGDEEPAADRLQRIIVTRHRGKAQRAQQISRDGGTPEPGIDLHRRGLRADRLRCLAV